MRLRLNGEDRELPAPLTVARLLETLKIASGPVAVEVNREVIRKAQHANCILNDGDQVEIVTFVGGG